MKIKKGFSLLELTLVLGVGTMVAFMKFQDMRNEQEAIVARSVGQQMKQMGEAVNKYISIRYDKLATLSNAAGNGTDPGPRTCTTSGCDITYQTLINEGLLPSSYTGINVAKSSYKIFLKRSGTSPNYVINGLVTTSSSWTENGAIRYDLIGKAIQEAGIDSGVTKTATTVSGYNGQWTETATNFPIITTAGQFAYRAGYDAALYSVYLRRDGTLPMTGDLNMGGNNISNAKNITASGTGAFGGDVTAAGNINANKEITAHNGYGDAISIGGDAATNDYEIRLGSAKPLSIYGPSLIDVNVSGSVNTSKDINAGNWLTAKNGNGDKIMIGGDNTGDYDVVFAPTKSGINTVDFFSSGSATPFDFSFRGNVNALNAAGTTLGASMNGTTGEIFASGNLKAKTLLATSTTYYGGPCTDIGAISKDTTGNPLVCSVENKWVKSNSVIESYNQNFTNLPVQTSGMDAACIGSSNVGAQQQYSFSITPIQNEMIFISFTGSLGNSTNPPTPPATATPADTRISNLLAGTGCVYINNEVCTGLSNIGIGRTGSMSCLKGLISGQTYNFRFVLGNNYDSSVSSRFFNIQYVRTAR
ncbi:hypothetical protein [Edwardsiella tarda]